MEVFSKDESKLLKILSENKNSNRQQKIDKVIDRLDDPEVRINALEYIGVLGMYANTEQMKILTEKFLNFSDTRKMVESKYWRNLINSAREGTELYRILGQNSNVREAMLGDLNYLINYTGTQKHSNDFDIAKAIVELEGGPLVFSQNLNLFLPHLNKRVGEIIAPCIKSPEASSIIRDNFRQIERKTKTADFFVMVDAMEGNPLFKEEYDRYSYFSKLYKIALEGINNTSSTLKRANLWSYNPYLDEYGKENKIIGDPRLRRTLDIVFGNLVGSSNIEDIRLIFEHISNGQDIQYKGIGSTSVVFQTGNQILKLSDDKFKYDIPYHPRIMMPNFRQKYEDLVCIEVFDEGDNDVSNISDDIVLQIFKELESAGIFWADARKDNLVRLLKDNNIPDYIISPEFNVFGFLEDKDYPTNNHQVLKKGEYVVSDLDLLFRIDDPNIIVGCIDNSILKYMYESGKYKFLEGKGIPRRGEFEARTGIRLNDSNVQSVKPIDEDYSL